MANLAGLKLDGPSTRLVQFLRIFVKDTFGHDVSDPVSQWPPLEDIFTFGDLSANTGHHLGKQWSASSLRVVRRALLSRSIRMLNRSYILARPKFKTSLASFDRFVNAIDIPNSAVLSLNWDTVLENRLSVVRGINNFDYGCNAQAAVYDRRKGGELVGSEPSGEAFKIIKPHGSFNWVYCDICRKVFWVRPDQTLKVANQIFRTSDWSFVKKKLGSGLPYKPEYAHCPSCVSDGLGTRLATFSYRKALDFPMYSSSWTAAESLLREAESWVFIGYSMPAADFEFKLLLKRVQAARQSPAKIIVVAKDDETLTRYKQLFGSSSPLGKPKTFGNGLDSKVMDYLRVQKIII